MYDTTDPAAIPATAPVPQLVAGYVDGQWPTYQALKAKYPAAVPVSITTGTRPGAEVCDCETGDATPSRAATWAANEHMAGRRPTIYMSYALWATVRAQVDDRSLRGDVDYWVADYPAVKPADPVIPPAWAVLGCVAWQYADVGYADLSVVNDTWKAPVPQPGPLPSGAMITAAVSAFGQNHFFHVDGGIFTHYFVQGGAIHEESMNAVAQKATNQQVGFSSAQGAVTGSQLVVTAEDTSGRSWYFAQTQGQPWGVLVAP
jgi:hypothetical protein